MSPTPVVCVCPACGAEARLVTPATDTLCPTCGAALGLTDDVAARLTELQRLHGELADQRKGIDRDRRHQERTYGRTSLPLTLGYAAAVLAFTFAPIVLWLRGVIAEDTLGWLVPMCMFGSYLGLGIPLWMWQNVVRSRRPPDLPIILTGPPTAAAVEQALADATREVRSVRLDHFAQPRTEYLRASRRSAVGYLDLAIGGAITLPIGLAAAADTIQVVNGDESDPRIAVILWSLFGSGVMVILLLRWRRYVRLNRIAAAVAQLEARMGGPPHRSHADAVAWLNAHWAAPTPADDYFAGPYHVSAGGNIRGYDVMIDMEPYGISDDMTTMPPRAVLYVAAGPAGSTPPDRTGEAARLRASIERAGFEVHVEPEAGLTARATPQTVAGLRAADMSRLPILASVLTELVALAVVLGAVPPGAAGVTPT